MRGVAWAFAALIAADAAADIAVPVRTIRPRDVIMAEDVAVKAGSVAGALSDPAALIGQEARVVLYPGRPVRPGDIGPPAVVGRNDAVVLVYRQGGLHIVTDGRSLGRGAAGDTVRVMNLASRTTVTGQIRPDGSIEVQQ